MSVLLRRCALLFLILLVTVPLFAFGAKEDPLVYIDKLIDEQKYDEAILYLTDFMKQYPERFDEAQSRLKRIVEIRAAYNERAKDLLTVITNEPTNNEKKLAMIKELQSFEKNPSTGLKDFIDQTKSAALFTYNRAQFESIMNTGKELLSAQKFIDAAKTYQGGFVLYRDEFVDSGIDQAVIDAAFTDVDAVNSLLSQYEELTQKIEPLMKLLAESYKALALVDVEKYQGEAYTLLRELYALRISIKRRGMSLQDAFTRLNAGTEVVTENSFLPFAYRLVLGRKSGDQLEGLVGAIDADWIHKLGMPQAELEAALKTLFDEGILAYNEVRWETVDSRFSTVQELCSLGMGLMAFWNLYVPDELLGEPSILGQAILASKGADYIKFQHSYDTAGAWKTLAAYGKRYAESEARAAELAALPKPVQETLAQSLATIDAEKLRLYALYSDEDGLKKTSQARAETLAAAARLNYSSAFPEAQQSSFDAYALALSDKIQAKLVELAELKLQNGWLVYTDLDTQIASAVDTMGRYLDGETVTDPLLGALVLKYPGKALDVSALATGILQSLQKQIADLSASIKKEANYVSTAPVIVEWLTNLDGLNRKATASGESIKALVARAGEQKRLADSARLEAERRIAEANAAMNAGNFEVARERLERARERYNASLAIEENPALRAQSDTTLDNLAKAILKAENDKVVADTRKLLTQGKNAYFAGNFVLAEDSLLEARSRWKTTHPVDPEPEVEYWIRLVQNAVTIQSGRDIPVTAPLYPEMSQILALAQKYYEEGAKLLSQKNTPSALRSFALARQKIEEVKLMYPLNRDARILDLKIDKLTDSDAFYKKVATTVQQARAKIQSRTDLATAYSDLKDIEALEPGYSGLKALIADAEILLGLRLPPPDPKALAESRNLTQAAQRIFDSRDITQFPNAVIQLNRALELNPNNEEASRLKDRIATFIGGTSTIVLPAAGEAIYNEAVRLFSNGEYLLARGQLAKLVQTYPQAAKMQKVIDLEARLAALGY